MKLKTKMRFHLIPGKMDKIKTIKISRKIWGIVNGVIKMRLLQEILQYL